MVVMEEKERYEWNSRFDEAIKDNQTGDIVNAVEVLNKQDKQIKELEEQTYPAYKREHKRRAYLENIEVPRLEKENEQLKQELHDLPEKIVEDIKQQIFNNFKVKNIEEYEKLSLIDALFTADTVIEILDTILKSMEGKKMEKAICSECGRLVEIVDGEEWGYCPYRETPIGEEPCKNCHGNRKYITRPPQSWCYVEELENE